MFRYLQQPTLTPTPTVRTPWLPEGAQTSPHHSSAWYQSQLWTHCTHWNIMRILLSWPRLQLWYLYIPVHVTDLDLSTSKDFQILFKNNHLVLLKYYLILLEIRSDTTVSVDVFHALFSQTVFRFTSIRGFINILSSVMILKWLFKYKVYRCEQGNESFMSFRKKLILSINLDYVGQYIFLCMVLILTFLWNAIQYN